MTKNEIKHCSTLSFHVSYLAKAGSHFLLGRPALLHQLVSLLHREDGVNLLLAVVNQGGAGLPEVPRPLGDELRVMRVDHLACIGCVSTARDKI